MAEENQQDCPTCGSIRNRLIFTRQAPWIIALIAVILTLYTVYDNYECRTSDKSVQQTEERLPERTP